MAGGKSSRMKQDKALLSFGEYKSLAEYQYQRLLPYFDKIYISAKSNKFNFDIDIIEDSYTDSSPLIALISIFRTLDTEEVFILPVDAPFVSPQTIKKIYTQAKNESDVIIAKSDNGLEPLCGIYKRSVLAKAEAFLKDNNHRLQALLKAMNTQTIIIDEKQEFVNLNHPFEYEEAKKIVI